MIADEPSVVVGPSAEARVAIIEALTRSGPHDEATARVVHDTAEYDPHPRARRVAMNLLARHWPDRPGSWSLVQRRTNDPWRTVRCAALELLGTHWPADPRTLSVLGEAATTAEDEQTRLAALAALATIGPAEDATTDRILQDLTSSGESGAVQAAALTALASRHPGDAQVGEMLRQRAEDDGDPQVTEAAFRHLRDRWQDDTATSRWMRDLVSRRSTSKWLRGHAAAVLARCDRDVLRELASGRPHEEILNALAWPAPEADDTEWLHDLARTADNEQTRAALLSALAGREDSDTHLLLRERAVADTSPRVRLAALDALDEYWGYDPQTRAMLDDLGYQRPHRPSPVWVQKTTRSFGVVETVAQWVAVAVAAGVTGNAAYDALKTGIKGVLSRPAPPEPTAVDEVPARMLTVDAARRLAQAAVLQRCAAIGVPAPDFTRVRTLTQQDAAGRWTFTFHEASNRRFHVRVPAAATESSATVHVYIPG